MRLFINGNQIDLYEKQKISYTKQVNSLKDLSSRQTNFTGTFKVPKTERNRLFFKGLGIVGSTSPMPYQKNSVMLFGKVVCIIFIGWAIFRGTDEDYEIYVYDGNIDFFKELDNVKFEQISLPELEHTKTVQEIKDNWETGNAFFKYLLADYNGKTHFSDGTTTYVNTDYLIPAVSVKFLWERIFESFGFTYSGTIFQDQEFLNEYLTYPKGTVSGAVGTQCFNFNFGSQKMYAFPFQKDPVNWLFSGMFEYTTELNEGEIIENNYSAGYYVWKVPEAGFYNIKITGVFKGAAKVGVDVYFYMAFGMENFPVSQVPSLMDNAMLVARGSSGEIIEEQFGNNGEWNQYLYAGQTITFIYDKDQDVNSDNTTLSFDATVSRIDQTAIDQFEFFKGLSPKDFYREVLWRFGLTPFSSKDSNHIEFLTWNERINGAVEDWSDRFIRSYGEAYVYDGYAKNNYFRFKYNQEEDDFNDGVIKIQNENLDEKTDVINSKTYSVERYPSTFDVSGNLQKVPKMELWQKEVKEVNGTTEIEYESRDSRFTFLREKVLTHTTNIGSEQLGVYNTASQVRLAENANYSGQQIIDNRYHPLRMLFNNTRIIKAEFRMTEAEFDAYDLKPRISVKQMGGEFIVDKLTKRDLDSLRVEAELIKINR